MAWKAGERITAARLSQDSGFVSLASTVPTSAATFTDWGTEQISFPDPGVAVKVLATVSGRAFDTTAGTFFARYRVMISFDGGGTFTDSEYLDIAIGDASGHQNRSAISGQHHRDGTPTGDIVVKAQCFAVDASTVTFNPGFLSAVVVPQ